MLSYVLHEPNPLFNPRIYLLVINSTVTWQVMCILHYNSHLPRSTHTQDIAQPRISYRCVYHFFIMHMLSWIPLIYATQQCQNTVTKCSIECFFLSRVFSRKDWKFRTTSLVSSWQLNGTPAHSESLQRQAIYILAASLLSPFLLWR